MLTGWEDNNKLSKGEKQEVKLEKKKKSSDLGNKISLKQTIWN